VRIYVDHLRRELAKRDLGLPMRDAKYYTGFKANIEKALKYYRELAARFPEEFGDGFLEDLRQTGEDLSAISISPDEPTPLPVRMQV
jgi:hypothetical protein